MKAYNLDNSPPGSAELPARKAEKGVSLNLSGNRGEILLHHPSPPQFPPFPNHREDPLVSGWFTQKVLRTLNRSLPIRIKPSWVEQSLVTAKKTTKKKRVPF